MAEGGHRPPVRDLARDVVELPALRRRRHHRRRAPRRCRAAEVAPALDARRDGAVALRGRRASKRREARTATEAREGSGATGSFARRRRAASRRRSGDRCSARSSSAGRSGSAPMRSTSCETSLRAIVDRLDVELPEYLPIVGSADGMVAGVDVRERRRHAVGLHLTALLSQVLLAYTLDFERGPSCRCRSPRTSCASSTRKGMAVGTFRSRRECRRRPSHMALNFLAKTGYVAVEAKVARLTPKGLEGASAPLGLHDAGRARLEGAVRRERRSPSPGFAPEPRRAAARRWLAAVSGRVARDRALRRAHEGGARGPCARRCPTYPMVLHRGGWPDGS